MPSAVESLATADCLQTGIIYFHLELRENQVLAIEQIDQLVEPVEQQVVGLGTRYLDSSLLDRPHLVQVRHNQRREAAGRLGQQVRKGCGHNAQADVGRVVER